MTEHYPYCIATVVAQKAIDHLLEAGTSGAYKDAHPWVVAADLFATASKEGKVLPVLFAVAEPGQPLKLSHWSVLTDLDVSELHRGHWQTVARFAELRTMHPIWEELDSVALQPTAAQLAREAKENLTVHRYHLDEAVIRPYAICETPAFILQTD